MKINRFIWRLKGIAFFLAYDPFGNMFKSLKGYDENLTMFQNWMVLYDKDIND